jgi:hypothetical protein
MRDRILAAALCLTLPGCEAALEPRVCTLIAVEALTVTVVNAATGQRICDATVTATEGAYIADLRPFGPGTDCSYSGPTERAGRYEVHVSRSGYEAVLRRDVIVTADECHVIPVRLDFDLSRAPAP